MSIAFYCINLDIRSDRKENISKEFDRLGIKPEWWIIKRHPQGGKWGCFESHVHIWKENKADIAVIFEDDVKFNGSPEEFKEILEEAIEISEKYTTVHLSHIAIGLRKKISANFYEGSFITTSCYLGQREKLKELVHRSKSFYGCHIDLTLTEISKQAGLLPYRFEQDFNDSNNSWVECLPVISKWTELDRFLREFIQKNPYGILKIPPWIPKFAIKLLLSLNIYQQIAPTILYETGVEFTDRRAKKGN